MLVPDLIVNQGSWKTALESLRVKILAIQNPEPDSTRSALQLFVTAALEAAVEEYRLKTEAERLGIQLDGNLPYLEVYDALSPLQSTAMEICIGQQLTTYQSEFERLFATE